MIAKVLDMEESTLYDELSDEQVRQFSKREEKLVEGLESYQFHTDKRAFDDSKEVKIRLLCNQALTVDFRARTVNRTVTSQNFSKVIIHFHGGGFLCQDSAAHQSYTRKWAINVDVPVFSVDYRLAPKNAYPDPVNDSYQAYVWIITQAKE